MVAVVDSCHFPFVSLFLDVIHIWCLNDMQANNQIKGFGGVFISFLSHETVNFLLIFSGSMEKAKPPKEM